MTALHYRLFSLLTDVQYKKSKHFYVKANKSFRRSARTCIFLHSKYSDRIKRHSFLVAYPFIFMSSFHVLTLYKPQQITPLRFKLRCNVEKVRYPIYELLCATNCPPIFRTYLIFQLTTFVLFNPLYPAAPKRTVQETRLNHSDSSIWQLLAFDKSNAPSV